MSEWDEPLDNTLLDKLEKRENLQYKKRKISQKKARKKAVKQFNKQKRS